MGFFIICKKPVHVILCGVQTFIFSEQSPYIFLDFAAKIPYIRLRIFSHFRQSQYYGNDDFSITTRHSALENLLVAER
jgi:hypothetical protein